MRQVINKLIREEDLYAAVDAAYSQGWRRMKLYFLTGLPTETDEDTLGIAELAKNCVELGKKHHKSGASVTVSVGGFVPKPFTPFQWFGQNTREELQRLMQFMVSKGLSPVIDTVLPMEDAREGFGRLLSGDVVGKIVLTRL